jgi:hypothetical protein
MRRLSSIPSIAIAVIAAFAPTLKAGPTVDFNREVRPILSANCFKCHGIDDGARKAKLRLDVRDTAIAPVKSGKIAIVPGAPDSSELVRRVFSSDPDVVMPPASTHVTLTADQKRVLREWIGQGAPYATHWAFVAPVQAPLPAVSRAEWVRNPIDRFVLARLDAEGLKPSPEADRYTLIRRLSLDLIGLPPTPEEADAFAKDASPDAYEKVVDRLLASPHYGERWARRWLDLARYADTNGFEKDRPRSIWPYRDWVIKAMNADMPFDQFTVEQLAGDMLPNATAQQRIATGFHRNTMLNEEGGIDPLEYRFHAMIDRVGATGTVWLGLTVRCAQCHTHKFDPITQTEYYRMMAFLNNADEPEFQLPIGEDDASYRRQVESQIAKLTDELPDKFPVGARVNWATPAAAVSTVAGSIPQPGPDGSWSFTGPSPERDTYTLQFDSEPGTFDRIRLETLKDGKTGPGRTPHGNYVLTEISATVAPIDEKEKPQDVKFGRAEADASQNGFPVERAIDGDPTTGWAVDTGVKPIAGHTATFFFEKPVTFSNAAHWTVKLDQQYGQHHTIAHLRLSLGTQIDASSKTPRQAFDAAFATWEKSESNHAAKWTVLRADELRSSMPILTQLADGSVLAGGDTTKSDTYDLTFHSGVQGVTAVRLEALPDESLPRGGPGMVFYEGGAGDFFLSEISLIADGKPARFSRATNDFSASGFAAEKAIDGDPQTGWSINGGQGKPHVAVFSLAEPAGEGKELKLHLLFERYFAAPLGHFRISVTNDPRAREAMAMPPEVDSALATASANRTSAEQNRLPEYFASIAPELADARKQIEKLRDSLPKPTTSLVMREWPAGHVRPTFVHHRGEFLQTDAEVQPGVPSFLPPLPAGQPANRLTFARWIVDPANPLTARVAVNRQWQAFFGRGIVRTLEDFGYQGDLPTHPELLDWLAVQFMKDGWSMKKMHRLIVTSTTYRQTSVVSPDLLEKDPQNILLARGPRFRMEAEVVRDSVLEASSLLSEKLGGPSVYPPQPASVTTEGTYGSLKWIASTGEDRYRRSLYTFSKRTAPFAMYNTFDAPTGEECIARRETSDTPLQALTLLNDTVFVEAAQQMGRTYAGRKESDEARAADLFRRCVTRPPDDAELTRLATFVRAQRERFAAGEIDAARVAGAAGPDAVERATWTIVARAVMNLDEAVTNE